MDQYKSYLEKIQSQDQAMRDLLLKWSNINSHSYNVSGLEKMLQAIKFEFVNSLQLNEQDLEIKEIEIPAQQIINSSGEQESVALGKALSIRKNTDAAIKVFLGGHMDTVFPIDSSFQEVKVLDANTFNGPGVADLKGGLIVMLKALEAFEASPWASKISWEVLINPDEEIGSPGSAKLLEQSAKRNQLGLVYEPSLADGSVAYRRKGSGNYLIVFRGKAAHVGREFTNGCNAVVSMSKFINFINKVNYLNNDEILDLSSKSDQLICEYLDALDIKSRKIIADPIIMNAGQIEGGGPVNVVADFAILKINIRIEEIDNEVFVNKLLNIAAQSIEKEDGSSIEIHGSINRKPKIPDEKIKGLYEAISHCAENLGQTIKKRNTGGCCDGNNLFEYGLANIDTLGVRGGNIHSDQEFVALDSLVERAQLSALFLMKLANGDFAYL